MKRFTQDESYKRIILKVENLAEQMSVRLQKTPFPENNTDVPVEQVVERGTDDDVHGIPMTFIRDYYSRVQEQFKNDTDVDVAKSQVSRNSARIVVLTPPPASLVSTVYLSPILHTAQPQFLLPQKAYGISSS